MRLSVGSLRQVVKRDLPIEFVPQQLTSYGGLELLRRYVRRLALPRRRRTACAALGGDYSGAHLGLLVLALLYVGVRRLEHLRYLAGPKQFCSLLGPRTLLGQTLDRVGLLIPPGRTVVVGLESHERYLASEFDERPGPHVLNQPESRGTAAAVLFAAQWIAARDPPSTVVFLPSDHFIQEEGVSPARG